MAANFSSTLRGVSPGASACKPRKSDMQAIGQKGDEDVRLNTCLELMKDGPDREVTLQILECLLDCDQQQIMAPQLGRVFLDEVGAQKLTAFARSGLPQFVAIEPIAACSAVCGDLDDDQGARRCGTDRARRRASSAVPR